MTWRIENTDTLALLRELPANWAQSCVAYAAPSTEPDHTLTVFTEVLRVLREDGTLWLITRRGAQLPGELPGQGWIAQPCPSWGTPLALGASSGLGLSLFTKQACYFTKNDTQDRKRPPARFAHHVERCANNREAIRRVVTRCILASTSAVACGACGAPYTCVQPNQGTHGTRLPTCAHHNPRGRCLVLDPFYAPGNGTLEAAHSHKRAFLGILDAQAGDPR